MTHFNTVAHLVKTVLTLAEVILLDRSIHALLRFHHTLRAHDGPNKIELAKRDEEVAW